MNLTFHLVGIKNKPRYIYYSFYAADGRVTGSTRLTVEQKDWDDRRYSKAVKARLQGLERLVDSFVANKQIQLKHVTGNEIKELIESELYFKTKRAQGVSVISLFTNYIKQVQDNEILNNGKPYSASTQRTLNKAMEYLKDMYIAKKDAGKLTADDIKFYSNELVKAKLSQNTISIYSKYFLYILRSTYHIHGNEVVNEKGAYVKPETIEHEIALTEAEVIKIYNLEIKGKGIELYRDKFVLGCFIGQRFSDHKELSALSLNGDIFTIKQQKTGKIVPIPFTNPIAIEIWKKYKGQIPIGNAWSFSRYIKQLCKEAGITNMVLFSRTEGGNVIKKYVPKWTLASTHTMRRTWATCAYLADVPLPYIQRVLGHKSILQTEKYLRPTIEQLGQAMLKHKYFEKKG